MSEKQHCLSAADVAIDLSARARAALTNGKKEAAMALVGVAHTYSFMAEAGIPLPRDGGIMLPYTVAQLPVPRTGIERDATDARPEPEIEPSPSTVAAGGQAEEGNDDEDADGVVPALLLRAYQAVVAAGGVMYGTDLAEALGIRAQQIGKELAKILRTVGISRPRNGTVRVGPGEPYRNGYLAETLAAAIAAYRVRAELANAA